MQSAHASAADLDQLAEVVTSALAVLESPDWPGSLRLILQRYLRDVEQYLARMRVQPDDVAPLIWALEATSVAWGLLELAISRRQVPRPSYAHLRARLDDLDRDIRQLVRSRQRA